MADLARALVIDRSALGHNLKPLERDGLIALLEGQTDRRQRRVVLTAQGQAKLRQEVPLWNAAQNLFLTIFGEPEGVGLRATLLAIAHDNRLATLTD